MAELADEIESHLPADGSPAARRDRALAVVALCVGGIAVARGVGDDRLARQILRSARERACAALREG